MKKLLNKLSDKKKHFGTLFNCSSYIPNGTTLTKDHLLEKVVSYFKGDLMTFHTNGYAKVLCFRAQAFKILHIAADNEEEEDVISAIKWVSKRMKGECDDILIEKSSYSSMINKDICGNMMSKTLQT